MKKIPVRKHQNNLIFALTTLLLLSVFVFLLVFNLNNSKETKTSSAALLGDCNGDGRVDILDFQILSNSFAKTPGQTGYNPNADLNNDTAINILDFQILSNNFGKTETATPTVSATKTPTPGGPTPTSGNVNFKPFSTVQITTSEIKFNLNGSGSNVDTIAFWEAPDPTQSLMFVTSKADSTQVEVYKYPFNSQHSSLNCGPATNGSFVDQDRDILYITQRYSHHVCAFNLPSLIANSSLSFDTPATGAAGEPNLAMLKLPSGEKRIYISYDTLVHYHNADTKAVIAKFTPAKGLETMYGDNYYQQLYIPDESGRSGVYIYDANGNPVGSKFGDSTIFDLDEEGIWVYKCPSTGTADNGEGLIVVADQKTAITDFEVFHRKSKAHLGKFTIAGVNNTDGISITQQSSPAYPKGIFAAIDDDTSTVGVGWETILSKTGLSCGN